MLRSLIQHPFITYTAVLSTAMAVVLAVMLRLMPGRLARKPWLFALPLAVPVVSYFINYVVLGKTCGFGYVYQGALAGLPSFHFFCVMNARVLSWIGPLSLAWLVLSLVLYGARRLYIRHFLAAVPSLSMGDSRAEMIIAGLCREWSMRPPSLHVLDCDRPVLMTAGVAKKAIIVSRGTLDLLDDDELKAALAHEMAHIERADYAANWLFILLRDLMMFSPASLWAYTRYRQEEENACDAQAATRTGLGVELASALVKFMRHGNARFAYMPQLLPGGGAAPARVRSLLAGGGPGQSRSGKLWAVLGAVLILALIFIC